MECCLYVRSGVKCRCVAATIVTYERGLPRVEIANHQQLEGARGRGVRKWSSGPAAFAPVSSCHSFIAKFGCYGGICVVIVYKSAQIVA